MLKAKISKEFICKKENKVFLLKICHLVQQKSSSSGSKVNIVSSSSGGMKCTSSPSTWVIWKKGVHVQDEGSGGLMDGWHLQNHSLARSCRTVTGYHHHPSLQLGHLVVTIDKPARLRFWDKCDSNCPTQPKYYWDDNAVLITMTMMVNMMTEMILAEVKYDLRSKTHPPHRLTILARSPPAVGANLSLRVKIYISWVYSLRNVHLICPSSHFYTTLWCSPFCNWYQLLYFYIHSFIHHWNIKVYHIPPKHRQTQAQERHPLTPFELWLMTLN